MSVTATVMAVQDTIDEVDETVLIMSVTATVMAVQDTIDRQSQQQ